MSLPYLFHIPGPNGPDLPEDQSAETGRSPALRRLFVEPVIRLTESDIDDFNGVYGIFGTKQKHGQESICPVCLEANEYGRWIHTWHFHEHQSHRGQLIQTVMSFYVSGHVDISAVYCAIGFFGAFNGFEGPEGF